MPVHVVRYIGGVEVQIHAFLSSSLFHRRKTSLLVPTAKEAGRTPRAGFRVFGEGRNQLPDHGYLLGRPVSSLLTIPNELTLPLEKLKDVKLLRLGLKQQLKWK